MYIASLRVLYNIWGRVYCILARFSQCAYYFKSQKYWSCQLIHSLCTTLSFIYIYFIFFYFNFKFFFLYHTCLLLQGVMYFVTSMPMHILEGKFARPPTPAELWGHNDSACVLYLFCAWWTDDNLNLSHHPMSGAQNLSQMETKFVLSPFTLHALLT